MKTTKIQDVYNFDEKTLVEMKHNKISGLFRFKDISDGEIYKYEKSEIPNFVWNQMKFEYN